MNRHLITLALCATAVLAGFFAEAVAYGQQPVLAYYYAPQGYCASAPQGDYLRLHGYAGGTYVNANYGCGQSVTVVQGGKPFSLETNQVANGLNYALEVDRRANCDAANAIGLARQVAPPIVAGNPCPQQCCPPQPIRGYCGRIVGYAGGGGSCCQQPTVSTTGYCGRTYCATPAPYCGTGYCGRTYCATPRPYCGTGYCAQSGYNPGYYGPAYDGRNPMIAYAPGDPRAVCTCPMNPNRNGPCACPSNCTQCNPNNTVGYVAYGR